MASITSWTRIEPRTRHDDIEVGLQARVHDAAWLLGRQLQLGEMQGEWAGSPIAVRVQGHAAQLCRYHPGPLAGSRPSQEAIRLRAYYIYLQRGRGPGHALDDWLQAERELSSGGNATVTSSEAYAVTEAPLEMAVEGETARGRASVRDAIDTGQEFASRLAGAGLASLIERFAAAYPLAQAIDGSAETDEEADYLSLASGRVPDGLTLRDAVRAALADHPPAPPATPAVPPSDVETLTAICSGWLAWIDSALPETSGPAWSSSRLEYQFATSARMPDGTELTLEASEYRGGGVDWFAFDNRPGISLGAPVSPVGQVDISTSLLPSHVRYPGMPATRFWEFEDAAVNLAAVSAGPEDLARLVLLEFGLIYANDWFVAPVRVAVGSVCQVTAVTVTDTFGQQIAVPHYSDADAAAGAPDDWRMYCFSGTGGKSDGTMARTLLVPSKTGPVLHGPAIEEVVFQRDNVAEMAWGIETTVEGVAGDPINRHEAYQKRRQGMPGQPPADGSGLRYRLATEVPDFWIPLVPIVVATNANPAAIRLCRGAMLDQAGGALPLDPQGEILQPGTELMLYEEEVPRAPVAVTRVRRSGRWLGGRVIAWLGREKKPHTPLPPSGLRFDVVDAPTSGS